MNDRTTANGQRNHLGRMLVLYRAARNIGIREMSREIGISAATASRIERGYEPDWSTALKVMTWLLSKS